MYNNFEQFQINLNNLSHAWSISYKLDKYGQFETNLIWTSLDQFGQIQTNLNKFGPFCRISNNFHIPEKPLHGRRQPLRPWGSGPKAGF